MSKTLEKVFEQEAKLAHALVDKTMLYLAGPMRGYPYFNRQQFEAWTQNLRDTGYYVFSPVERDIRVHGESVFDSPTGDLADIPVDFDLRGALHADLEFITLIADGVAVLDGWENSKGARAEVATALALGIPVKSAWDWTFGGGLEITSLDDKITAVAANDLRHDDWLAETASPLDDDPYAVLAGHEVRTTSSTGGQKGVKPERYSLLPKHPLDEVARHYGLGASKYTRYGDCTCGSAQNVNARPMPEGSAGRTTTSYSSARTPNISSGSTQTIASGQSGIDRSWQSMGGVARSDQGNTPSTDSRQSSTQVRWTDHAESAVARPSTSIMTTPQAKTGAPFATDATSGSATTKAGFLSTGTQHSPGCGALTVVSEGSHNWRKGYEFSKSIDSAYRHLAAWANGEDNDPELGTSHLAAVVFHAFTLMENQITHPEFDDRYKDGAK